jgi:riboflavin synthase
MFTGIIQAIGRVQNIDAGQFSFSATVAFFSGVKIGDSIATNGVCLTVVETGQDYFQVDLSQETLNCSIFGTLLVGDAVNLEKALTLNQGIDGHLVSGHVDGVAKVVERTKQGESTSFKISAPQSLVKYIAKKGSITINGVSLTVNSIEGDVFDVNIVPYTFSVTTLGRLEVGTKVNLEVDIIARYLEQLINNP